MDQPNIVYNPTSITVTADRNTCQIWQGGTLLGSFSELKKMPERDEQGGLYIILTDPSDRQFWFDVWTLLTMPDRTFAALDIADEDINDQYETRINAIYVILSTEIFKDCCCGDGEGGGSSNLVYNTGIQASGDVIEDTTTPTVFSSHYTIPEGPVQNTLISHHASGLYLTSFTPPNGINFRWKLIGAISGTNYTLDSVLPITLPDMANYYEWNFRGDLIFNSVPNVSCNVVAAGRIAFLDPVTGVIEYLVNTQTGGITVDSTEPLELVIEIEWLTADPNSSIRQIQCSVWQQTVVPSAVYNAGNAFIVEIARATLQSLIALGAVSPKTIYRITDAIGATEEIRVFGLTATTISDNAENFTTGEYGVYDITADTFVPIAGGGFIEVVTFGSLPVTGASNTLYYVADEGNFYVWDGAAYFSPEKVITSTASGTDTYTGTGSPTVLGWEQNVIYKFRFTNANTGASTYNLDAVGAVAIVDSTGAALVGGEIPADSIQFLVYDGTDLRLMGGGGSSAAVWGGITGTITAQTDLVDAVQNSEWVYGATTGTNTYLVNLTPALTAYQTGQVFWIKFNNANTGASTLNINSLGAIALVKSVSTALASGDIPAGAILPVMYDGTNLQVDLKYAGNPTFQAVLLAGATMTQANTVAGAGFQITWSDFQRFLILATDRVVFEADDGAGNLAKIIGRADTKVLVSTVTEAGNTSELSQGPDGWTFNKALYRHLGTALASAATVNIGAATGDTVHITGTTTITAFDTVQEGTIRHLVFDAILTLTDNANIILLSNANIVTAADDTSGFVSEGGGVWRQLYYQRASGSPLIAYLPLAGGSMSGAVNDFKGADIASAATTDIGAATGNYIVVTGTTTITALGTVQAGAVRIVRFSGVLTLTHNATSLILPTSANITTANGDMAIFVSEGSGNWRCVNYAESTGNQVNYQFARVSGSNVTTTSTTAVAVTGLTLAVAANSIYKGRIVLRVGCSGVGGMQFGFNFPAGGTLLAGIAGNSTATTAQQMFSAIFNSGTVSTTSFNTVNAQSGFIIIDFTIETVATAGNVELIFKSVTAGQTSTIYTNFSNIEMTKIA